jgi:hypothetical protein
MRCLRRNQFRFVLVYLMDMRDEIGSGKGGGEVVYMEWKVGNDNLIPRNEFYGGDVLGSLYPIYSTRRIRDIKAIQIDRRESIAI